MEHDMEIRVKYLEGHGDLVSRLIMGIVKVIIGVMNLLTSKSP